MQCHLPPKEGLSVTDRGVMTDIMDVYCNLCHLNRGNDEVLRMNFDGRTTMIVCLPCAEYARAVLRAYAGR
jgi:hypothetical protein